MGFIPQFIIPSLRYDYPLKPAIAASRPGQSGMRENDGLSIDQSRTFSVVCSELARNVQKIQPIKFQSITLSTNHMRALRVFEDPETGFKGVFSNSMWPLYQTQCRRHGVTLISSKSKVH